MPPAEGKLLLMVVWWVLIFVHFVAADVPALRGTVEVGATRWVMPVDEMTLTAVPVYRDEGSTDPPHTLSPGACQVVASAQSPRSVTVKAHNARMAVVQYHAPGFLDPHECEDGALVQVPAGHVHQWVLQADAQAKRHAEEPWVVAVILLALGFILVLSLVRGLRALGWLSGEESRPSRVQPRPKDR